MFDYKHAVIYQIWPRSFMDSNGDGIGDLQGIISRLDYIKSIGADAIWLSPVYQSPNTDYGYDISDYRAINPEYGTMEDMDQLITEAGKRGIAIIMDLVANHTSTRHPWFQAALHDPSSPYRSYYHFVRGKKDAPPDNWMSFFGTSAWQKAEDDMWYLTLYTDQQADLNWNNPDVRKEIASIMKFWLEKGIAGFRMDTINTIDKAEGYPDKDPDKKGLQFPSELVIDRPMVKPWLDKLRETVLKPYDAFALGEGVLITPEAAERYGGGNNAPLNMMFQFDLAELGNGPLGKYDPRRLYRIRTKDIKQTIRRWMNAAQKGDFWIGNYLSNHDRKRHLDRYGDDGKYRTESAEMLAMMNFTLLGTPFIYQGEEIAMTNPKLKKKDWRDYEAFHSSEAMEKILHIPSFAAERISSFVTRDNARTPVQWSDAPQAGFTTGSPWIPVNSDYKKWNVKAQENKKNSVLHFYQHLAALHKEHEALCTGSWVEIAPEHPSVFTYMRENDSEKILVQLNLSRHHQNVSYLKSELFSGKDLLSNYEKRSLKTEMTLQPYEAHLYWMSKKS